MTILEAHPSERNWGAFHWMKRCLRLTTNWIHFGVELSVDEVNQSTMKFNLRNEYLFNFLVSLTNKRIKAINDNVAIYLGAKSTPRCLWWTGCWADIDYKSGGRKCYASNRPKFSSDTTTVFQPNGPDLLNISVVALHRELVDINLSDVYNNPVLLLSGCCSSCLLSTE